MLVLVLLDQQGFHPVINGLGYQNPFGNEQFFTGLDPAFIVGAGIGRFRFSRRNFSGKLGGPLRPTIVLGGCQLMGDRKGSGFPGSVKDRVISIIWYTSTGG